MVGSALVATMHIGGELGQEIWTKVGDISKAERRG
jgi:hypothetical protein